MGIVRMRNKITGEFRDTDDASVDFIRLKREVGPDGMSKWEQTGDHDVRATVRRAQQRELLETDMGKAAFPLPLNAPTEPLLGPEHAPHKALTPGEVECGITSREMKAEQEQDMHMRALMGFADDNQLRAAREQAERGEGPLATHPSFRRERALSLSTAAIAESDVEGLEDDEEPAETAAQRRRRLARERREAKATQAVGDPSDSGEEE